MIRITQLKLPADAGSEALEEKICRTLRIRREHLKSWEILRRSVDARKKPDLYYVYTIRAGVERERALLSGNRDKKITRDNTVQYRFPRGGREQLRGRPVIIGSGPAGLFCGYMLASAGYRPLILERGDDALTRQKKVSGFWEGGELDTESNVQFGEGGAGTFSDGKLNTSVRDPKGRIRRVLEILHEYGAPEEILYDARPHLGTDQLIPILMNMRSAILDMGGSFQFRTRCDELVTENGRIQAVRTSKGDTIASHAVVLAIGHSARDTFRMLYDTGVNMEEKAFAIGLRAEHSQSLINLRQYGTETPEIGAAAYRLTHTCADGRGVYSFCMCPGGYVVNASSEKGMTAVNGMSYHARDSRNANSAIVVTVSPEDFRTSLRPDETDGEMIPKVLSGMAFQQELEKRAFEAGKGAVPVQTMGEYLSRTEESREKGAHPFTDMDGGLPSDLTPCIKGAFRHADVRSILPAGLAECLREGFAAFDRKIPGFAGAGALLSGIESRTSSPVRILRDENMESSVEGLYPCGEGAGYAGGITSAAADGLRCAEAISCRFAVP